MTILAERLMLRSQESESHLPEAIFGTAGTLGLQLQAAVKPARIAIWPIISDDNNTRLAMGLQVLMGYLLGRFPQIQVYGLLVQVDSSLTEFYWDQAQSQFTPATWQLEDLDNNVRLSGKLIAEGGSWTLSLTVEGDEGMDSMTATAVDLASLIGQLDVMAERITSFLGVGGGKSLGDLPEIKTSEHDRVRLGLESLFDWSLKLYLNLCGRDWPESEAADDWAAFVKEVLTLDTFGLWLAAHAMSQYLFYRHNDKSIDIRRQIDEMVAQLPDSSLVSAILAETYINIGAYDEAQDLLMMEINAESPDALAHLALALYHQRRGHFAEAVDTFQDAIEADFVSAELYQRYGDLLVLMDYNRFPVASVVQVDPDEIEDDLVLWEAVESYESAIDLRPDDPEMLNVQLHQLVELGVDDARLWQRFAELVHLDEDNRYVPTLIDALYALDDVGPGISTLREAIERESTKIDHYLNLAALYLVNEDSSEALAILGRAAALDKSPEAESEIQRLSMLAEDPDFERRLGELTDITSAGNALEVEDAEYLEGVLERVPTMPELYILLAQAYRIWDDDSAAIETLLDGHGQLPNDPDITALLGEVLWDADEQDLAFSYLKKGLAAHPNHVPLLAIAGQCLFEDGQQDAAKVCLARAEAIAPRHPTLGRVRNRIAGAM